MVLYFGPKLIFSIRVEDAIVDMEMGTSNAESIYSVDMQIEGAQSDSLQVDMG